MQLINTKAGGRKLMALSTSIHNVYSLDLMHTDVSLLQVISLALHLARPAPPAVECGTRLKTAAGVRYQSRGTLVVCKVSPGYLITSLVH